MGVGLWAENIYKLSMLTADDVHSAVHERLLWAVIINWLREAEKL